MAMYQPSELRDFLHQLGIAPKKGLSQNFLIDGNIVQLSYVVTNGTAANGAQSFTAASALSGFNNIGVASA